MKGELSVQELQKIPYVEKVPQDGRIIILRSYYDEGARDWIFMIPIAPGKLGRMAGGEPVVAGYFAKDAVDPACDLRFPLGTFVAQHASFPEVVGALEGIETDIYQFCAILEKYDLLAKNSRDYDIAGHLLLNSELEYLVILIRALYDLLQKASWHLTAMVKSTDGSGRRVIRDLGTRFSKVVLDGDRLLSQEEIVEKFGLPEPIATFYAEEAPRFKVLRDLRVSIEHHGKTVPTIFDTGKGAAVIITDAPWNQFDIWKPALVQDEKFGSLRGVFAYLIKEAIELTTRYTEAFTSCIGVPHALSPSIQLYLRHPFGHRLVGLSQTLAQPWERA